MIAQGFSSIFIASTLLLSFVVPTQDWRYLELADSELQISVGCKEGQTPIPQGGFCKGGGGSCSLNFALDTNGQPDPTCHGRRHVACTKGKEGEKLFGDKGSANVTALDTESCPDLQVHGCTPIKAKQGLMEAGQWLLCNPAVGVKFAHKFCWTCTFTQNPLFNTKCGYSENEDGTIVDGTYPKGIKDTCD